MTPTEIRLALKAAGFSPIPCEGKIPGLRAWQTKFDVSPEEVATWARWSNTGMLLGETVGLDADIMQPDAAAAVEETVTGLFDGRGRVPVRFGNKPKRALLLRTAEPFAKMSVSFTDPKGGGHRIEVLGKGQQIVVHGEHPDTGAPYTWFDGCPWSDFCREDLVEVTEQEMRDLLEMLAEMLERDFGFKRADDGNNGTGQFPPINVDARLAAVLPGDKAGGGIHDTGLSCTASLLRSGHSVDAAVLTVLEEWRRSPDTAGWDWEDEERKLRGQCFDFVTKHPELSCLLPDDLREGFEGAVRAGKRPKIVYRKGMGWHVRGLKERSTPDGAAPAAENEPRKYRFKLVSFSDLKPGPEPLYLVDELIPAAGLVDVWGKAKCFKSFWCLDLMLHVTMGWEYRDRYVRQGAVVYCAFEGAHGYKKRVEALRRHYDITAAAVVPLYVMPGQANLIAEHRVLIADTAAQLGDTKPAAVVLDTLNKSLFGSESKDTDMGAYVRAAEAIRDHFGCVVIIIHHCGYDDTRPRGHSSLPGAVDAQLSVVRTEEVITVTVEMMRDGPEDTQVVSATETVEVGQDQNGKMLTSLVVVPSEANPASQRRDWPRGLAVFHVALKDTLAKFGEVFQPEAGVLPVHAVSQRLVRDRFYTTYADASIDAEEDSRKRQNKLRQAFGRALSDAQGRDLIKIHRKEGGQTMIWLPQRA